MMIKILKKFKNVNDCTDHLKDFLHTAYFVEKMDMIFTVDTSLVHMAGTMNKKHFYSYLRFLITDGGLKITKNGIHLLVFLGRKS